jgi:hypothetical protein
MELEQGKAHKVSDHMVGITNVYEAGGTKLASIMVLEPTSRKETPHRLAVNDVLTIGTDKYKVTAIKLPAGGAKGSITIQKA